jgi:putative tryptophan/tyrosine transport system substrate-binding protein
VSIRGSRVRRRDFINLLGGAAAWPSVGARAQERTRYIGVLLPAAADDTRFQSFLGAFLQELARLGWTDDRSVRIDTRWTSANAAEIRKHARELVEHAPDVVLAHGDSTVGPLLQVTRTVLRLLVRSFHAAGKGVGAPHQRTMHGVGLGHER